MASDVSDVESSTWIPKGLGSDRIESGKVLEPPPTEPNLHGRLDIFVDEEGAWLGSQSDTLG